MASDSAGSRSDVLLLEKELRYSGENGIRFHPMVVRSIASFPLKGEKAKSETHAFDLADVAAGFRRTHIADFEKYDERHNKEGKFRFMEHKSTVDPADLAVVAFVQDGKTKAVLQSVTPRQSRDRVSTAVRAAAADRAGAVGRHHARGGQCRRARRQAGRHRDCHHRARLAPLFLEEDGGRPHRHHHRPARGAAVPSGGRH